MTTRSSPGYYIAVVVLGGLLIAAVALVAAMIARPGQAPASVLAVTDRAPISCPGHERGTCFETQVTNNGSVRTGVRCEIRPSDGSIATFATGATTTQIVLETDQSVHLDSIVVTENDAPGDAPTVSCVPVPT